MTTIMLIRHGETNWNVEEVFRGQIDIRLNETGVRQAELLAKYLKDVPIIAVYSSPLKRAVKTAQIIASGHNTNIIIAPELTDLDYGEWQGLSHEEVREKYEKLYGKWLESPHLVRMPKGEGLDDVRRRSLSLVEQVILKYEGTVALVSHRVVHKVLICALLGLEDSHFWNIKLDTCGITAFVYENNRYVLVGHNDISFLKPIADWGSRDF